MPVDAAVEEQFGPYLVYERLGVGGMATVHRALEQGADGFERMVALKRLLPHLAEDASFIKSFVREAKLASLLNHVNIVQIYELGRVGTEYFITMEYIDGRDVRRILRHARKVTGPPPIHVTVGLLLQLCDALDYAHSKVDEDGAPLGLVHRDISPSNLIVTSGGHLKIIDFGIAKAQSSQLRTQTGRVKGKLAYMAPEAISGSRDLDARSDIWATGVILHELLTARPLFASKNEYQTLLKVKKGDILPPSTFNQACPPELDAIVFRALARHADERFSNAAELREELQQLKRQYSLQTGYRDVASWVDWAFGLEPPPGFTGDTSGVMSVDKSLSHSKTPRPPQNADEEEAVEVVWGTGAEESQEGMPVVLDEVPDVSEKVRTKRDTEDDRFGPDDIPTPQPSHGTMPSIYGTNQNLVVLAPTTDPGLPPKLIDPALARGTDPPMARGSDHMRAQMARPTQPQPLTAPRTLTGQSRVQQKTPAVGAPVAPAAKQPSAGVPMPAGSKIPTGQMPAVRAKDASIPPQTQRPNRPTAPGVAPRQSDRIPTQAERPSDRMKAQTQKSQQMTAVDVPNIDQRLAAVRGHDSIPPVDQNAHHHAQTPRALTLGDDSVSTNPIAKPLSAEELFGIEAEQALSSVSAQIEAMATHTAMPAHRLDELPRAPIRDEVAQSAMPSVPVVRFSKTHSIPPTNTTSTANKSMNSAYDPARIPSGNLPPASTATSGVDNARVPSTKPGIAPVNASAAPHIREPRRSKPPSNIQIGQTIAERAKPRRTWLFVVAGLLLAGGTAAVVSVMLTKSGDNSTASAASDTPSSTTPGTGPTGTTPSAPIPTIGTIKFVTEPADAEIKIDSSTHAGSPFTSELAAGIHQVEIRKPGFKSWLTSLELSGGEMQTLRVVLEPLAATPDSNATLMISTTPPGLDVVIDGQPFKDKSPIKTTLTVGSHTVSVKQNGVEVWKQTVNAEASSDYEFNPSFTDDKKRERAQEFRPKAPAPAPAPAPTPTPPAAPQPKADTPPAQPAAQPATPSAPTPAPPPTAPAGAQPPATSLSSSPSAPTTTPIAPAQ
ncbi:MAG TPA: protein kinase [Kofleriaceae bacterium]|nr:protein kinase [Kofleriaceae bacterium]